MSIRYKFREDFAYYFVTFAVIDWIDVFTRNEYREIVIESIAYCIREKGLNVHGWVLMTNHVHLVISLQPDASTKLSDIMRDMKKYTAMQLIKSINEHPQESRKDWMMAMFHKAGKYNSNNTVYQFWRQDNHPLQLNTQQDLYRTLEYIHNNPVNAGLVDIPENYLWSSARDYEGKRGRLSLVMY